MKKLFKTIAFVCLATMAVVSCDENNDNPIPSGETFDLGEGSFMLPKGLHSLSSRV